jgi:predicted hydrocarbon binding protein
MTEKPLYELERYPQHAWITMPLGPQSRLKLKNRVIILGAGTFVELQKGAEALLGEEAAAVFYEAGIRSGSEAARSLLSEWEERGVDFIKRLGPLMESTGIGWLKVEEMNVDFDKKEGHMRVRDSFIARTYGHSEKPVCHFLCGFFSGFLSEILGERMTTEETTCESKGDSSCEFQFRKY